MCFCSKRKHKHRDSLSYIQYTPGKMTHTSSSIPQDPQEDGLLKQHVVKFYRKRGKVLTDSNQTRHLLVLVKPRPFLPDDTLSHTPLFSSNRVCTITQHPSLQDPLSTTLVSPPILRGNCWNKFCCCCFCFVFCFIFAKQQAPPPTLTQRALRAVPLSPQVRCHHGAQQKGVDGR